MMNTETNKTIMRQIMQAIDQGDWAALETHPGLQSIAHQGVNRVKRRKQHAYRSANYQRER
ncbi:MAG: hypothetical protein ACOYNY_40905 [Caldilineaceae bacterium]